MTAIPLSGDRAPTRGGVRVETTRTPLSHQMFRRTESGGVKTYFF